MATEKQFGVFKLLYEEEQSRLAELTNKSKIFFSVNSLVLGALFFKIDVVLRVSAGNLPLRCLIFLTWLAFLVSLGATLTSLFIREYERLMDPTSAGEMLHKIREESDNDSDVDSHLYAVFIGNIVTSVDRNMKENSRKAWWLSLAGWFALVGYILALAFLMTALCSHTYSAQKDTTRNGNTLAADANDLHRRSHHDLEEESEHGTESQTSGKGSSSEKESPTKENATEKKSPAKENASEKESSAKEISD